MFQGDLFPGLRPIALGLSSKRPSAGKIPGCADRFAATLYNTTNGDAVTSAVRFSPTRPLSRSNATSSSSAIRSISCMSYHERGPGHTRHPAGQASPRRSRAHLRRNRRVLLVSDAQVTRFVNGQRCSPPRYPAGWHCVPGVSPKRTSRPTRWRSCRALAGAGMPGPAGSDPGQRAFVAHLNIPDTAAASALGRSPGKVNHAVTRGQRQVEALSPCRFLPGLPRSGGRGLAHPRTGRAAIARRAATRPPAALRTPRHAPDAPLERPQPRAEPELLSADFHAGDPPQH